MNACQTPLATAPESAPMPEPASVELDELLPLVYGELRRMAAQQMARESRAHTLQPTALVHEAWTRLSASGTPRFQNRAHFFRAAADGMRRILVESARRRHSQRRGGDWQRIDEPEPAAEWAVAPEVADEMLAVNDAVEHLDLEDPEAATLVKLRYFVGMDMTEAAAAMGITLRAAERTWTYSKAWLRQRLSREFGERHDRV